MNSSRCRCESVRSIVLNATVVSLLAVFTSSAEAAISFLGVAAGDASTTNVTLWTRAVDDAAPANTSLAVDITTDSAFATGITHMPGACTTDSTKDYVCKVTLGDLKPNTVYYYRFVGPGGETSLIGRVKTAPASAVPVA
jgi:alkaline phosphatase D